MPLSRTRRMKPAPSSWRRSRVSITPGPTWTTWYTPGFSLKALFLIHISVSYCSCLVGCISDLLHVPPTDRAAEDQPKVGSGSVEPIQARLRRNQWLSDGGQVFCVSLPSPHRLPGGCSAAGAKFAGKSLLLPLILLLHHHRSPIVTFIFFEFGVGEFLHPAMEMYMRAHEKRLCCCEGFAGRTGEAGKQSEEVWCSHPPAAKGVSPLSVRFSQQCAEGHQCEVIFCKFLMLFHKLPKSQIV